MFFRASKVLLPPSPPDIRGYGCVGNFLISYVWLPELVLLRLCSCFKDWGGGGPQKSRSSTSTLIQAPKLKTTSSTATRNKPTHSPDDNDHDTPEPGRSNRTSTRPKHLHSRKIWREKIATTAESTPSNHLRQT